MESSSWVTNANVVGGSNNHASVCTLSILSMVSIVSNASSLSLTAIGFEVHCLTSQSIRTSESCCFNGQVANGCS